MVYVFDPLIIALIVSWFINFYLFGMQRASLLISRHNGVEWHGIGEQLLPNWYPLTWFFKIAYYCLLIAIAIVNNWLIATGLLIAGFILLTIVPIPYRLLYKHTFRRKVNKISSTDPYLGDLYTEMLDNTDF